MTTTTQTDPSTENRMPAIASIGDTLAYEEAAAIAGCTVADLRAVIAAAVTAHGEREGAADYSERAADVAAGLQPADWAWPMVSADEAYINAVGSGEICRAIGIDVSLWDEVSSDWLAAFVRGYSAAAAAAQ